MTRIFSLTLVAVLLLAACDGAKAPDVPAAATPSAAAPIAATPPAISFGETEADLGDLLLDDEPQEVFFEFRNSGGSPLRISKLTTSCNCADASVSAPLFRPDTMGKIAVEILPDRAGRRSATVAVHSDDPARRLTKLQVRWRTLAPIAFEPAELIFGSLLPGANAEAEVKIVLAMSAEEAAALEIGRVDATPRGELTATLIANDSQTPKASKYASIHVKLRAGSESGYQDGRINVYLGEAAQPSLVIPVEWRVQDTIEVSPSSLFLGAHPAGTICGKWVLVSCAKDERLEVAEASLSADGAPIGEVEVDRAASSRLRIRVSLIMPATPGIHNFQLTIKCSHPVERTLVVPVTAFCQSAAPAD